MEYISDGNIISVSVTELCSMANHRGHLDNRQRPPAPIDPRDGTAVHRYLTSHRPAGYAAEVSLSVLVPKKTFTLRISGRADGVMTDESGVTVEEIKTVRPDLPSSAQRMPRDRDMTQLRIYGYMLCLTRSLKAVRLRLTYAVLTDDTYDADVPGIPEEPEHIDMQAGFDALSRFVSDLTESVGPELTDFLYRETVIRPDCRSVAFPYPSVRPSQEEMIRFCHREMARGRVVFAAAPTGTGKTMAAVYSALRLFGEGRCDRIFYLTARSTLRREAFGAVAKLTETGLRVRACVITAREHMCINEKARLSGKPSDYCNPDACPYARNYYDRVLPAIRSLLSDDKTGGLYSGLVIKEAATKLDLCPYEFSLDLSAYCQVILCDYNYVFSPSVYLRRYFSDGIPHTPGNRSVWLMDEAHNMPDRVRAMYSSSLSLSQVIGFQEAVSAWEGQREDTGDLPLDTAPRDNRLRQIDAAVTDDIIGQLESLGEQCLHESDTGDASNGAMVQKSPPSALLEAVDIAAKQLWKSIRIQPDHPLYRPVTDFCGVLNDFLRSGTAFGEYDGYVTYTEVRDADVSVHILCLDPTDVIRPILRRAEACLYFSATLSPLTYFTDILGGDGDRTSAIQLDSPFTKDNLCVSVCDCISTRFEDRKNNLRKIAAYIAATVSAKTGHYIVYFPSYVFLDDVFRCFSKRYPDIRTVCQTRAMDSAGRAAFISSMTDTPADETLVGFCVLGGSFSEGIDLPGRSLIGAIVVGVGIPGLSEIRNLIKEYYDTKDMGDEDTRPQGYAYAYVYPGLNRVLQAAGRVIRREDDVGVVVLLDTRWSQPPYTSLYPDYWHNMSAVGNPQSLYRLLSDFWSNRD